MIGAISPVADSLIQIGGVSFTLPTRDSSNATSIQLAVVFSGVLLTGVFNYLLQNRLLYKQRVGMDMERRRAAYSEFLRLADTMEIGGYDDIGLGNNLAWLSRDGSETVKPIARRGFDMFPSHLSHGMDTFVRELKPVIEGEITKMESPKKPRWQFWK
jgi:hypothetical protein